MPHDTMAARYRLSQRVRLTPVRDLPQHIRSQFTCEEGDVALDVERSRRRTQILSPVAASLLISFAQASDVIDVVIACAKLSGDDPSQLLDQVWPVLQGWVRSGILLPEDTTVDTIAASALLSNIGQFLPSRLLQDLDGVQIYEAYGEAGQHVCLKVAQLSDASGVSALQQEVLALHLLSGCDVAKLHSAFHTGKSLVIATEWIDGELLNHTGHHGGECVSNINLNICLNILRVYADLHRHGIIHGDVHPGNLLIARDGRIVLIDFGSSFLIGESWRPGRNGVPTFYDPELADALLVGGKPPPASCLAEQFSVGILIYGLLTGRVHPIDLSNERDEMLRQLCDISSAPIKEDLVRAGHSDQMAAVIKKALSRTPSERHESMQHMLQAFQAAIEATTTSSSTIHASDNKNRLKAASQFYLDNKDVIVRSIGDRAPRASITYGAAGVAILLANMSRTLSDPRLLTESDVILSSAMTRDDYHAYYNEAIPITESEVGRNSLYHTRTGILCAAAEIAVARGDLYELDRAIAGFLLSASTDSKNDDLTLGSAGLLVGSARLIEAMNHLGTHQSALIRDFGDTILDRIWNASTSLSSGPLATGQYLGLAHGIAGILYGTLRFCMTGRRALPKTFMAHLEHLMMTATQNEDACVWPARMARDDYQSSWCNGSAGFILLWCEAYEAMQESKLLGVARRAGKGLEILLKEEGRREFISSADAAASLCCGRSGAGFAFLRLYHLTGEALWYELAASCLPNVSDPHSFFLDGSHSLYKGRIGMLALLNALCNPHERRMPFL